MGEIRQNRLNGQWVIYAPRRGERPRDYRRHWQNTSFSSITEAQRLDLGTALQDALSRLYGGLDDPHYNHVFHSSAQSSVDAPHLHWYLQICPRLTTLAGFEIGSGMRINPSIPEEDAGFLRETAGEPWRVA